MMIPHSRPTISEDDVSNVVTNLRSGLVAYGDEVTRFEQDMSKYIGVLGGVATNSGTSALHLPLKAPNIVPGHEVILPSYVCVSVLHAVKYCGASPVFADIEDGGYNLDSKSVDEETLKHQISLPTFVGSTEKKIDTVLRCLKKEILRRN